MRVYCGIASGERQLSVAVIDDAGRLLTSVEVADDPTGYAVLGDLLSDWSVGGEVPIATDRADRLVALLLAAAGRCLAHAPDGVANPVAEGEEPALTGPARQAYDLARALQAGALVAAPQPAPRDLAVLKPVLSAHAAVTTGRQAAVAALRDVLRELYPAALQAFGDPSTQVALAVLAEVPEPGLLGTGRDGARRDTETTARLVASGLDQAEAAAALAALRGTVSAPGRRGLGRALTAAAAEAVRQAVAAVRACDAAALALLAALAERIEPRTGGQVVVTTRSSRSSRGSGPTRRARSTETPAAANGNGATRPAAPAAAEVPARPPAPPVQPAPPPAAATPPAQAPAPRHVPVPVESPRRGAPTSPVPAESFVTDATPTVRVPQPPYEDVKRPAAAASPPVAVPPPPRVPVQPPPSRVPPQSRPVSGGPVGADAPAAHYGQPVPDEDTISGPTVAAGLRMPTAPPELGFSGPSWAPSEAPAAPPVSVPPASHSPASHSPASHSPASHSPASHSPASHSPATHSPATHSPATHSPAASAGPSHHAASASHSPSDSRGASPSTNGSFHSAGPEPSFRTSGPESSFGSDPGALPTRPTSHTAGEADRPGRVPPPWQSDDLPAEPPTLRLVEPVPDATDATSELPPIPPLRLVGPDALDAASLSPPEPAAPPAAAAPAVGGRAGRLTEFPSRGRRKAGGTGGRAAAQRPAPPDAPPPVEAEADGDLLIFAATRSAWFSGYDDEQQQPQWDSGADIGWKAAEQASRPAVGGTTTGGLPRRVPQANLVPGSASPPAETPLRVVRDPAQIAAHTTGYFRGWRRGRGEDAAIGSARRN